MNFQRDLTHDPSARSFVETANVHGCDFPIQNLPFGAFTNGQNLCPSLCVAIGDKILDLCAAAGRALLGDVDDATYEACRETTLNALMGLGPLRWRALRLALFNLLHEDSPNRADAELCLRPQQDVKLVLPVCIGNYTDFYASIHHATNVGALFRPNNPLLPNYKWVPIGYHGRASSIVVSGTPIRRPAGQLSTPAGPHFAQSRRMDYEIEIGALVGVGNELGEPVPIAQAGSHIFGLCLVNDWSARDIQSWEYQPLGPFLAKSFATSISPWVVTTDALIPFRVPASPRPAGDPQPLPYLADADDQQHGGFELTAEVYLQSSAMRDAGCSVHLVSRGHLSDIYWTFAQMLAHQTCNGCNLHPGDLLASGTISGPQAASRGCLLEITRGGTEPLQLPNGELRSFLEDGDEVRMRAYCQRPGAVRIGLGECVGTVLVAR